MGCTKWYLRYKLKGFDNYKFTGGAFDSFEKAERFKKIFDKQMPAGGDSIISNNYVLEDY